MTEAADLDWTNPAGPRSRAYDDLYFSGEDGLAESRFVFLDGVGLNENWAGRRGFTIGETGFGTGLNFLAAWDRWRRSPDRPERLHFLSVEAEPLQATDIRRAHARWPELADLSARLADALPAPVGGFHRRHFDGGRVTLTLLHGDGATLLASAVAHVDAWFLDGFAPERNPALWTPGLFETLGRLSAPGARLATFTAAGHVRRTLADAGFEVERRPGFGRKRHMTVGRWTGSADRAVLKSWPADCVAGTARQAIIVGAGVGGCAMAQALRRRDWSVTVIDRNPSPGSAASGNPAALLQPRAQLNDDPWTLFGMAADGYTRHIIKDLAETPPPGLVAEEEPLANWCGGLELAVAPRERHRQTALAAWTGETRNIFQIVDRQEASDIAGIPVSHSGRWYPDAGWIAPLPVLSRALGSDGPLAATARHARRDDNGLWQVYDSHDRLIAAAPVLILATGAGGLIIGDAMFDPARHTDALDDSPDRRFYGALRPARGRITEVAATGTTTGLRCVLSGDGYIMPAGAGRHMAGATYVAIDPAALAHGPAGGDVPPSAETETADDQVTLSRIASLAPSLTSARAVGGRSGIRITTADRRPFAGPVPGSGPGSGPAPGLFTLSALGSRGFGQAWLLADMIASHLESEPLPMSVDQIACVDPSRFGR
ncbi:tRNA (5-methylaminomethyl-2-thiouridine)(34)-methyltransferase MnmD [Fodinicurvata sp. EGI_FJ10296]|uniref:tRNA (5-methylaminomethyl-2-thiouridine)(34)-methyltransferase MnmD n=1 Tax=Fodinicurvata sp. EGI_FJ10296 TaxID=3231908 RepID=UPI0034546F45